MKLEDLGDHIQKASKSACSLTIMVSPDPCSIKFVCP